MILKTYSVKAAEIKKDWHVIDAKDKTLGRLATEATRLLMGKHKSIFSRHLDTGDFVIIINAEKIIVSGNKEKQKLYHRHSGYPSGFKSVTLEEMLKAKPDRVIFHAVKGMLPKNRLGRSMIKKLKVYIGDSHPHFAKMGDEKQSR
jgi:large subunit ribosomal protein L13